MSFWVYIMECSDKSYYTGNTDNLEKRISERQIKGWSRKKKEALIRGDWEEISRLAQSRSNHPSTGSG